MGKRVAIVQSCYVPWKGYFDLINLVDEFILFDDAQYTKRDWRNRNRIKAPCRARWLTIPVQVKGRYFQKINETVTDEPGWNIKHWRTIAHNYSKAEYFKTYREVFEELYLGCSERYLSLINYRFIAAICRLLDIRTKISWSMDYELADRQTERIISLCRQAGATQYLSGPTAKAYLDEGLFEKEKIALSYMDYSGYPEYEQLYEPFEHDVSVIDLILNKGHDAPRYMKSF